MEAIFLVCGVGGPQLKRNPLGTGPALTMTVGDSNALPYEAEQFLSRLGDLSSAAWQDIVARDREPLIRTIRYILRGFWLAIVPARLHPQFHTHYSRVAAERLQRLAETQVLPMHRLSWGAYHAAGSALQALCNRGFLGEGTILEMYAPFEPHIPLRSLQAPATSGGTGLAGA